MSFLYTFKDMINSCTHHDPEGYSVGEQKVPVCRHPENINPTTGYGYCDADVCPVCGKEVREGQQYEASKRSKYTTVYAHSACLRNSENKDNGVRMK